MRTSRVRLGVYYTVLACGLAHSALFGTWQDQSAGVPILDNFSAKELGRDEACWTVLQDRFGRLLVGSDGLQVFDGVSWQSFPMGATYAVRALAFGRDDRLWVGATNEVGYFEETSLGKFNYHSLIPNLPLNERLVGDVWACTQIGRNTYFVCRDKLLRWDGASFQIQPFYGKSRLFPLKLDGETWFQHLETGLYRLTEAGPQLEIPASSLPETGMLGIARDGEGMLLAGGAGFYRPGSPARPVFSTATNDYIAAHRLASFAALPDGNYAVGTLNGGLAIVSHEGELLRTLDTRDGLLSRAIISMQANRDGRVWCTTPSGIFNFEALGHETLFNALNGLRGKPAKLISAPDNRLYALTIDGSYQLKAISQRGGRFQALPQLTEIYNHLLPIRGGLLLSRQGGMDFHDGTSLRSVFTIPRSVYFAVPTLDNPDVFYLSEAQGVSKLTVQPDGTFVRARMVELPDACTSIHEDSTGRLWLGTVSKGAYIYDPVSGDLNPINDPVAGRPLEGEVWVVGIPGHLLLFLKGRVLQAGENGADLKPLTGIPPFQMAATTLEPKGKDLYVAFKRITAGEVASQGLGVLSVDDKGQGSWQELAISSLPTAGFINTMQFTQENDREVLWIGGSTSVLRLDSNALGSTKKPITPFISIDTLNAGRKPDAEGFAFFFHNHRLKFRVFAGDYTRGKEWLFQYRLGDGREEWSLPSARRSFEFSNLSEGTYDFEVRTVNSAGMTSEPSIFNFSILPPWYRSGWAYGGYATVLALGILGVVRIRERNIRARNQELETLVGVRTAELVKASAAKDEFLAGVSHEIRNPMNGVIGIAETFKTEDLDPENRRKFGLLRQCANHLSSLLEDILDFSKVQAGAIELDPKPFDLPELVESIAAITGPDSEKYGIPVEIAVSPAVPRELIGDPRRIRQILINFVSNALKFSGRGEVSVTVWCKNTGATQTEVIFAVSDEGPGISPDEQTRLFTRFERGAAAQKGRVPGTGLGLALCKGLAEKMGGRLWLESELGRGSCFYFSVPLTINEPAVETAAPPSPAAQSTRTALVVDDQEYNRIVLADLLQTLGFTVITAQDGSAALTLAGQQAFDVVFLDYNLPGLSGLDVSRGIRALPTPSAHALILATTAFTTPEKRSQCLDAGMDAFLGKPVTMERLRKALAVLERLSSARSADLPPQGLPTAAPSMDGMANLRLLAGKKRVPFAQELALYFSELDVELAQLEAALHRQDAVGAGQYAHMLCGRCSFIYERELEQTQRKIEAAVAIGQWEEAHRLHREFTRQLADLRARLASSDPTVPRG